MHWLIHPSHFVLNRVIWRCRTFPNEDYILNPEEVDIIPGQFGTDATLSSFLPAHVLTWVTTLRFKFTPLTLYYPFGSVPSRGNEISKI